MVIIKDVKVKKTVYSAMKNPDNLKIYLDATILMSSEASLYKDPAISNTIYADGRIKSKNISDAKAVYKTAPTSGNHGLWLDAGTAGINWLNALSEKVEPIANADANRSTRVQAATNISLSYLTPQQLENVSKGNPETPQLKLISVASGSIDVEITNGSGYNPSRVVIIAVETRSGAVLSLDITDLVIEYSAAGSSKIKSAAGKGALTHFTKLIAGEEYDFYAYALNGKKQISELSVKITRKA